MNHTNTRLWEVDALRGVAIVMMVIYHLLYDLNYFRVTDTIFTNLFWFYFQRVTAGTFLVLVGVSLTLSVDAWRRRGQSERTIYGVLFRRGRRIFGWGLVITAATWFFFGWATAVKFGILHFIGVAIMLAFPFLTLCWTNLALWIGLSLLGRALSEITISGPWLLWLGIQPMNHVYVDYFPLIPWFGVVLLGVFLGNMLYTNGERRYSLPLPVTPFRPLQRLGERSLLLYLIHQPLLFALLAPIIWLWRSGT
ncbi:MAG TPA: heparan-alpha-glucosaminide N-acetyltransferase [Caldilineaceae bacterium]|nr:heparan-alpha-glucosaminide N-acetyltransferase [Caldilineaceae bacterium]